MSSSLTMLSLLPPDPPDPAGTLDEAFASLTLPSPQAVAAALAGAHEWSLGSFASLPLIVDPADVDGTAARRLRTSRRSVRRVHSRRVHSTTTNRQRRLQPDDLLGRPRAEHRQAGKAPRGGRAQGRTDPVYAGDLSRAVLLSGRGSPLLRDGRDDPGTEHRSIFEDRARVQRRDRREPVRKARRAAFTTTRRP